MTRIALVSLACPNVVPLGMLHVASALRAAGHRVLWCEARTASEVVARLREQRVDVVGFGATTGMHEVYLAWASEVRRKLGVFTVMGGPHPTFVPDVVHHDGLDAICLGEAEESMVELIEQLGRGLGERPVAGMWFKSCGRLVRGPVRAPPQDLDKLPLPAVDLVYDADPAKGGYRVKPFLASRGCAYRCTYCANAGYLSLYGKNTLPVRKRTPSKVIDEIVQVDRRWGMSLVWLADASLLTDAEWAKDLVGRIRRDVRKPFFCKVRADQVNAQTASMLGKAGCAAVGLGIESGSERIRKRILGRAMPDDTMISACRLLRQEGIRVLTFNMLGIPTETFDDALKTVDLNVACGADYAEATLLQPYPGTPMAKWAVRKGHFDGDFDAVDYSYLSTSPFRYDDVGERDRLERLQKLLGLAVEFPEVRRALPWLVRLPLPGFHDALFRVWYRLGFGRRIHGVTLPW